MTAKKSSNKVTGPKVATEASQLLQVGRTSVKTKSVAGSALSQAKGGKKN